MIKRNNRNYYTVKEYCTAYDCSRQAVYEKIQRGTIETIEIPKIYVAPLIKKGYTYNGKEYTLKELSKETGIKYQTLYARIKRGLTVEESIAKSFL